MHVLTSQGISSITVPDELPALLRDFTKDVIRAQPTDLVHYAAVYFSALAGVSLKCSTDSGSALDQPPALHSHASPSVVVTSGVAHRLLPAHLQLDDGRQEAPAVRDPRDVMPSGSSAASEEARPSAAWRVSGDGDVVPSAPPLAQLYAGRRTSDRQLPPTPNSSGSSRPVSPAQPEAAAAAPPLQQAGAAGDTAEAQGKSSEVAAGNQETEAVLTAGRGNGDAGEGIAAKDEQEAALMSMAERLFREADADGSGALDRKEFRNVMRNIELGLSTTQVRALMAEADENEDGFVDWREFLPALLPLLQSLQAAKEVATEQEAAARARAEEMLQAEMPQEVLEALMRELFRTADSDGSGALSRMEFKACLRSESAAGLKLSRQDVNTLLTEVDADGNGLVDYEEFIPVAYNILVERLKDSLLAATAE